MLMMIMMTFDVRPFPKLCTPRAITTEILKSSPKLVMLYISITVQDMLQITINFTYFSSLMFYFCFYATCCFIAAFLLIKSMIIND